MIIKWLVTEGNLEEMVSDKPLTSCTICGGYYRTDTSLALWVGRLRREQWVKGRQEAAARWEGERKRKWGEQVQGYEIIQEEQVRTYIGISTMVSVALQVKLSTFRILKNFDYHKYRVSENNRGFRLDIGTYFENLTLRISPLFTLGAFSHLPSIKSTSSLRFLTNSTTTVCTSFINFIEYIFWLWIFSYPFANFKGSEITTN